MSEADAIIERLALSPHPEGGWYRQTWAAPAASGQRPAGTAIYFLLKAAERSHWHRVDADEIWLWHAGAALELAISASDAGPAVRHLLGGNVLAGQSPQLVVPAHHWQGARSLGEYTLVSCTVSPAFRFEGFELAAPGFDIA